MTTVLAFRVASPAVWVTSACRAPMSLAMRDWMSPARVAVKNRSESDWRWAYTATRRSCMIDCPTFAVTRTCSTPMPAPTAARATRLPERMPATRCHPPQGLVDDRPQQERGGEPGGRCQGDQEQDERDPPPVGPEKAEDARHRHMRRGEVLVGRVVRIVRCEPVW